MISILKLEDVDNLIAFVTAPLFVKLAVAEPGSTQTDNNQLEQNLILAMSWVRGSFERLNESNVPILGYVSLKPDKGVAYVDYRILRKPAYLFGTKIITIEEEYPKKDVGCCVSSGIGTAVKVEMSLDKLKGFAAENACSVDEDQKRIAETLAMLHLKADDCGRYASISCRDRDVPNNTLDLREIGKIGQSMLLALASLSADRGRAISGSETSVAPGLHSAKPCSRSVCDEYAVLGRGERLR